MTDIPKKTNMVKIRLNRDCLIQGAVHKAGQELEVSQEDANEFCQPIKGLPAYDGERSKPTFHSLQRAQKV